RTFHINHFLGVVISEADHALVIDGDIGSVDFTAEDIDNTRVFKEQLGWFFAPGYAQLVLDVSHFRTLITDLLQEESISRGSCLGSARASRAHCGASPQCSPEKNSRWRCAVTITRARVRSPDFTIEAVRQ